MTSVPAQRSPTSLRNPVLDHSVCLAVGPEAHHPDGPRASDRRSLRADCLPALPHLTQKNDALFFPEMSHLSVRLIRGKKSRKKRIIVCCVLIKGSLPF